MPDLVKMLNSQVVVAEEERVKFFILQDFWPAFKLFQFFGFFPITKVVDDNGNINLQPTKIWKSVIILSIWLLVLFIPLIGKNNIYICRILGHFKNCNTYFIMYESWWENEFCILNNRSFKKMCQFYVTKAVEL